MCHFPSQETKRSQRDSQSEETPAGSAALPNTRGDEESTAEATHPPSPCCLPGVPKTSPRAVCHRTQGQAPALGWQRGSCCPLGCPPSRCHIQDTPLGTLSVSGTVNRFKLLILNGDCKRLPFPFQAVSRCQRFDLHHPQAVTQPLRAPLPPNFLSQTCFLPRSSKSRKRQLAGAGTPPGYIPGGTEAAQSVIPALVNEHLSSAGGVLSVTSFALETAESPLIPGGINGNARGCGAASGDIPWGLGRDTSAVPRHRGRAATPQP